MRNSIRSRVIGPMVVACFVSLFWTSESIAEVRWQRSPMSTVANARQTGKPIVVYVSTRWCHYCKLMDQQTWADARVSRMVNDRFHALALDGDKDREVVGRLGLNGYPATLLFTPEGHFVAHRSGFVPAGELVDWLGNAETN